jgi:hypothetical protein
MRRRRLLLGAGLLAVLGLAAALFFFLIPGPRTNNISPTSWMSLRSSMTERDVEVALGGPAGDYRTVSGKWPEFGYLFKSEKFTNREKKTRRLWYTDEWCVTVWFDGQGRFASAELREAVPKPVSYRDRIRDLFPW